MTDKRHDVDPGPHATPEQRQKTRKEVFKIIEAVKQFHTPFAADYIRRNPPSAEVIATLAFYGYEMLSAQHGRKGGGADKQNKALQQVIDIIISELKGEGKSGTPKDIEDYFINNGADASQEVYIGKDFGVSDCDNLRIEEKRLWWNYMDGKPSSITFRSLEPYIKRAKENLK